MQIAIDIRSTTKKKTGIGYYTLNLVNNLSAIDKDNHYILYSKIGFFNRKKQLLDSPGANFRHLVNHCNINPRFLLNNVDIFHTSSYDIQKPKGAKLVVVVHDVIHKAYPQGHSAETVKLIDKLLGKILQDTNWVIAPTENTKQDFLSFYKFPIDKISVIYPGIEEYFFQNINNNNDHCELLKRYNINRPFILFVGTLEPRKNVTGLIKAFEILKKDKKIIHQLVISGMRGWLFKEVFYTIKEIGLEKEIIFTDYLNREEVRFLLSCADVFVYPSFYEGVGFPVLEAFASKTPVVTSNNSSLKEIALDCALLVDPKDSVDIAEAVFRLISDEELRKELKEKGLNKARQFSWRKTAQETLEVFNKVISK